MIERSGETPTRAQTRRTGGHKTTSHSQEGPQGTEVSVHQFVSSDECGTAAGVLRDPAVDQAMTIQDGMQVLTAGARKFGKRRINN